MHKSITLEAIFDFTMEKTEEIAIIEEKYLTNENSPLLSQQKIEERLRWIHTHQMIQLHNRNENLKFEKIRRKFELKEKETKEIQTRVRGVIESREEESEEEPEKAKQLDMYKETKEERQLESLIECEFQTRLRANNDLRKKRGH